MAVGLMVAFIIFARLFQLQVIQAKKYRQIALEKNQGYTEIPARRGEILIKDRHSGEPFSLATNTTLNLIFADPTLLEDPVYVGEKLAPLLFDLETERERDNERYQNLIDELEKSMKKNLEKEDKPIEEIPIEGSTPPETEVLPKAPAEVPTTETLLAQLREKIDELAALDPSYSDLRLHTDEELYVLYKNQLIDTLSQKTRPVILLGEELDATTIAHIKKLRLIGIEITENGDMYAYPPQISDKSRTAKALSKVLQVDKEKLENILLGRNRYTILKHKLDPDVSNKIEALMNTDEKFFGIRMQEEFFRFYPEDELGAQLIGYVTKNSGGQYGIESMFDTELSGKNGFFTSQIDASGKQITVGESKIQDAVNGSDIMLTIDRTIQAEAEKALKWGVEEYQADNGLLIVQEPDTGRILAMAHYPTFNPNKFSEVYELEEIKLSQNDRDNLYVVGEGDNQRSYLYIRKDPDVRIEVFYDAEKDKYYKYANTVGPEVYQLKAVTLPYEPGSVFKPIAMSAAIDAGEVTPYTTFTSYGPVQVDEYEIHTFNDEYYGISTMTDVLVHSDNTGMVFVAKKLGRALFYDYLEAFGFNQKTHIEFEGENTGRVEYYDHWADSELVTKAFGQGITVTPIQLITAISAIANGGLLMQPYMIDYIEAADGRRNEFEPEIVRRVLKEETTGQITAMMTAVVEEGAPLAKLETNYVAGKTGTAQTYKWGKALKGKGTTIASFVGFVPLNNPKFSVLIKLDRPKTVEWGASTAGPVFNRLAKFLVNYYNIPPDKSE